MVNISREENRLEIQIEIDGPFSSKSLLLKNPNRLEISLLQIMRFSSAPLTEVNDFGIKTIRIEKNQEGIVIVIFDLEDNPPSYEVKEVENGLAVFFWIGKEQEKATQTVEKEEILPQLLEEISDITAHKGETTVSFSIHNGFYFWLPGHFKDIYGETSF